MAPPPPRKEGPAARHTGSRRQRPFPGAPDGSGARRDGPPLPMAWPVYVTRAEACAYARWKGMRLPTEPEYHRAAFGAPDGVERSYPWGEESPDATRGNFDFRNPDPVPVGSFPAGQSAWGI